MVIMTEIGRRLAPEPVAQAALIPGGLIAELGTDEQKKILDDVAAGGTLLAFAHVEPGVRGQTVELDTRANRSGDAWTVSGRKNPVLAGDSADEIIVTAALPDGGAGCSLSTPPRRAGIRTAPSTAGGEPRSTSTPPLPSRWATAVTRRNISRAP